MITKAELEGLNEYKMRELNVPVTTEIFWGAAAHVKQSLVALEALTKLPETLEALNEKRVRELVYSEGLTAGGIGAFLRY